jgi:hypothetical protein
MKLLSDDARKAAEDEDEGAFLDGAFCCRAADAGGAAGDHGGLSVQLLMA